MGERPVPLHLRQFGLASFTTGCGCIAPRACLDLLLALQRGDTATADTLYARFMPLENLRESISLIRVLQEVQPDEILQSGGPVLRTDVLEPTATDHSGHRDWHRKHAGSAAHRGATGPLLPGRVQ
jgi:hypothetical protein